MGPGPADHPAIRGALGIHGELVVMTVGFAVPCMQLGVDLPTRSREAVLVGVLSFKPDDPAEEELTRAVLEHPDP